MTTPATPNVARMYDYWLGGKDNSEVDRRAADAVRLLRPNVAEQAMDNKRFQTRAGPWIYAHSWEEITGLFAGLELVSPGIVETSSRGGSAGPAQRDPGERLGQPGRGDVLLPVFRDHRPVAP